LSPTAAVPSVLVCGEVFVFKPFGWERNFKKMIQQPVYHFYRKKFDFFSLYVAKKYSSSLWLLEYFFSIYHFYRKKFDFFSLYVAKKYSSSLWLLEYFFLIYPKQNSTTQLPFLGEVRFYRCNYNDKIFSPTTAVPSVLASLWRSFCFQAIWLGKKF
jgi:hypothetical protein